MRYVDARHRHWYAFAGPDPRPDPFRAFSSAEVVEYDLPAHRVAGVHSSRLPVLSPAPWLIDVDCLITLLRWGRPFAAGVLAHGPAVEVPAEALEQRARLMLRFLLSPSCTAILVRSEHARREAIAYLDQEVALRSCVEELAAKIEVVRPAVVATPRTSHDRAVPIVLYAGRTFADKGGRIAASVFRALAREPLRAVWVGPAPAAVRSALPHVEFHRTLGRGEWLALLGAADVFVSPTDFESFGMSLVEAAAHGAAIVTTAGVGMEHVGELFDDGVHALLVDAGASDDAKAAVTAQHVRELVHRRDLLDGMQRANVALTTQGRLSIARRDEMLCRHYAAFATAPRDRLGLPRAYRWVARGSSDVAAGYRRATEGAPRRVLVA